MKRKNNRSLNILTVFFLLQFPFIHPAPTIAATPTCGELVKSKCLACHYETRICQKIKKGRGKGSWKKTIKAMIRHGAVIGKADQKHLITCLSTADSKVLELCGIKK